MHDSQVFIEGGSVVNQQTHIENPSHTNLNVVEQSNKRMIANKRKATKPISPLLRINKRLSICRKRITLSSEELELNAVDKERKGIKNQMLKNMNKYHALKGNFRNSVNNAATVARSTKKLTIPTTPMSHLQKRMGPPLQKGNTDNVSTIIEKKLSSSSDSVGPKKPTQFEPFKFATEGRIRKQDKSLSESTIPVAELIEKFHKDPRSHHVPNNAGKKITLPCSPKLKTKLRSKSTGKVRPLSYEQLVEQQMEEFEKNAFRAKPVNKKIFLSMGESGVPKVQARPATEPLEIVLHIDRRASLRDSNHEQHQQQPQQEWEFKARPMPNYSSVEACPPSPRASAVAVTIPLSPKLSGGRRASSAPARRQRLHHKEVKRLKAQQQEALRQQLRQPPSAAPTEPVGFQLATSARGEMHNAALQARLKLELQQEQALREVMTCYSMKGLS